MEAAMPNRVDETVQRLAGEASLLHQKLLAFLARGLSDGVTPSAAGHNASTVRCSEETSPHESKLANNGQGPEVSERGIDVDDMMLSGRQLDRFNRAPVAELLKSPGKVVAKLLLQQNELISAYALTKGREMSREYEGAKEELLQRRRAVLKNVAMKLHGAEQAMEDVLDKCSVYKRLKLSNGHQASGAQESERLVTVDDIVSYAHKISYSTFAPASFLTNQELPPGFQPPAPQAEHMRASALYQFSDEELGFRPSPSAAPIAMKPPEPTPESLPKPPPGWIPGMPVELPPMPPGWKPGMGLSLPPLALANLPPMPPGWKPGDPIPPPSVQPQIPPPGLVERRPQAQPIQVAHVDLDLNPDLEGGLYSSESEDEDDDSESEEE